MAALAAFIGGCTSMPHHLQAFAGLAVGQVPAFSPLEDPDPTCLTSESPPYPSGGRASLAADDPPVEHIPVSRGPQVRHEHQGADPSPGQASHQPRRRLLLGHASRGTPHSPTPPSAPEYKPGAPSLLHLRICRALILPRTAPAGSWVPTPGCFFGPHPAAPPLPHTVQTSPLAASLALTLRPPPLPHSVHTRPVTTTPHSAGPVHPTQCRS